MSNIKSYLICFCFGILIDLFFISHQNPSILTVTQDTNNSQIDSSKLTIKNCAPKNEKHGETWLGNDLLEGLKQIYPNAEQIFQKDTVSDTSSINIYMRGYLQYSPPFPDNKHINIAYVFYPVWFSHYDKKKINERGHIFPTDIGHANALFDEMQFYDAIAVASESYAEQMRQKGFKAYYIPQFTNHKRFYPMYDEKLKTEVLFIGSRPHTRQAPTIASQHKLPITIYGGGEKYIDNNELYKYYSSAKIVLNDHRADMKKFGFINNRIFDATACETLVISDYMPEIEKIYGDTVPMWKTEQELVDLIKYYLAPEHEEERKDKARRAREITLKNFTAEIVTKKFQDIITTIKQQKGL